MTLIATAAELGGLAAVEVACFERLGAVAPAVDDPTTARWLASASLAHAWRAGLLEPLLPVSVGLPHGDELTVLPGGPLGDALERCLPPGAVTATPASSRPAGADGGSEGDAGGRLVAALAGDLYPALLHAYDQAAARAEDVEPAAAGPVNRQLRRAISDLDQLLGEAVALDRDRRGR